MAAREGARRGAAEREAGAALHGGGRGECESRTEHKIGDDNTRAASDCSPPAPARTARQWPARRTVAVEGDAEGARKERVVGADGARARRRHQARGRRCPRDSEEAGARRRHGGGPRAPRGYIRLFASARARCRASRPPVVGREGSEPSFGACDASRCERNALVHKSRQTVPTRGTKTASARLNVQYDANGAALRAASALPRALQPRVESGSHVPGRRLERGRPLGPFAGHTASGAGPTGGIPHRTHRSNATPSGWVRCAHDIVSMRRGRERREDGDLQRETHGPGCSRQLPSEVSRRRTGGPNGVQWTGSTGGPQGAAYYDTGTAQRATWCRGALLEDFRSQLVEELQWLVTMAGLFARATRVRKRPCRWWRRTRCASTAARLACAAAAPRQTSNVRLTPSHEPS